jgi:oligoendopeptidase F
MSQQTPPRWNLKNVYPSLDSEEYASDFNKMRTLLSTQEDFLSGEACQLEVNSTADEIAKATALLIERFNAILLLAGTLRPYLESFIATDSYDKKAQKKLSQYEMTSVRTHQAFVKARAWFGKVAEKLPAAIPLHETVSAHAFFVREEAEQSRYLMTEAEEILAAELNLSSRERGEKLQGTLTSQLCVDFDQEARNKRSPCRFALSPHYQGIPEEVRRACL